MSVHYEIKDDILHIHFEASSLTEEIYVAINRAYQDPACPHEANILLDTRHSTSLGGRSVEAVRTLSQVMLDHPARPGRRIAILLHEHEMPRLGPMADEFSQRTGLAIRAFEDEDKASKWLAEQ